MTVRPAGRTARFSISETVFAGTSQTLLVTLLLTAAGVTFFWPTVESLLVEWTDFENLTYTHGLLIAAACVVLLVRAAASGPLTPHFNVWSAAALAAGSFAWLIAYRAGIELAHQALLPLLLLAILCTTFGWRAARRFGVAIFYLYFAIPVWNLGNGILQWISIGAVRALLRVTGIPAYFEGNVVHVPEGMFQIADGCSGIHFFIVALATAVLYGEVCRDSLAVRARQLAWAAGLALLCNWIRIYVIILAGHLTDMQHYLVRVDHYYFGWLVFAGAIALFYWIAGRMPPSPAERPEAPLTGSTQSSRRALALAAGGAIAATSLGPLVGIARPVSPAGQSAYVLPLLSGWEGPRAAGGAWHPIYSGGDRQVRGEYHRGTTVEVFAAEYDFQRQGKELIGYGNDLLAGASGTTLESGRLALPRGAAQIDYVAANSGGDYVIGHYYEIAGARTTSAPRAQLDYGLASLRGPAPSRVVAARAPCTPDCKVARAAVAEVLSALDARDAVQ